MSWASHPTTEMPTVPAAASGRHRRRGPHSLVLVAAGTLLVLAVAGAMFSPVLLGWPPPSQPAAALPSTAADLPGAAAVPSAATISSPATTLPVAPTATTTTSAVPVAPPAPTETGLALMETAVLTMTNAERAKKQGCPALRLDTNLRTAARLHSADMAQFRYLSHVGLDGRDAGKRMRDAGYNTTGGWAENIARGYQSAESVMVGWLKSEGHRANIENCSLKTMGVGTARAGNGQLYWTQDFGGR